MSETTRLEPVVPDKPAPVRFRPNFSLLWFSRRLGRTATHSFANVKGLLAAEVKVPNKEQLFGTNEPLQLHWKMQKNRSDEQSQLLHDFVERSHEVLAEASTIFPFTLFPDTVIVDRTKVTIIKRNFFWSEDVVSIRIEDVLNANAGVDPFFGSLNVSSRVMNSTDHYLIKFLHKHDAMHLKHLIQGYVIAQHNNIDVAHLSKDELIKTLCELGHDSRH